LLGRKRGGGTTTEKKPSEEVTPVTIQFIRAETGFSEAKGFVSTPRSQTELLDVPEPFLRETPVTIVSLDLILNLR
jgi:hypothetical protein